MVKIYIALRLILIVLGFAITLPNVCAQGGTQLFDQRRYVPQTTATPSRARTPEPEPIPRGWVIAGVVTAVLAGLVLLFAAIKAWRSSNLFERKYHFPSAGPASLRFGGKHSGGLMAAIDFGGKKID